MARVLFLTLDELLTRLRKATAEQRLDKVLQQLTYPKVLILAEPGCLLMNRAEPSLFFRLVTRRYERASLILTSNKGFDDWGEVLGDSVMATATLDRLLHPASTFNIKVAQFAHQPFDRAAGHVNAVSSELAPDLAGAVDPEVVFPDLLDAALEFGIAARSRRNASRADLPELVVVIGGRGDRQLLADRLGAAGGLLELEVLPLQPLEFLAVLASSSRALTRTARSSCRTHSRKVAALQPNLSAIETIVAHSEPY